MASFARMGEEIPVAPVPVPSQGQDWAKRLEKTIERGAHHLLSIQAEEGYWQGELEADTTLESDYIYYLHVLGKADPQRIAKLANYVRRRQLADGGWSIYPGGPSELNATCKAYFALKLAGCSTEARHMAEWAAGVRAERPPYESQLDHPWERAWLSDEEIDWHCEAAFANIRWIGG